MVTDRLKNEIAIQNGLSQHYVDILCAWCNCAENSPEADEVFFQLAPALYYVWRGLNTEQRNAAAEVVSTNLGKKVTMPVLSRVIQEFARTFGIGEEAESALRNL